jgi:flagellar biosynthesis protein
MSGPAAPRYARAVALAYDGTGAPRVSAKGDGLLAERIVELAAEHAVPLHRDGDLVEFLARVPLGDEIPEALYLAVAQVLVFAYQVSGREPPPAGKPVPHTDVETYSKD